MACANPFLIGQLICAKIKNSKNTSKNACQAPKPPNLLLVNNIRLAY